MSSIRSSRIRSHARFRQVHISALMQWRIWRAFSRPAAKQLRIEPGLARSNVRSPARV